MGARGGFWQGFLSDLANPKIGIFFTSLLPQFVDPGRPVLLPFMALGAVFVVMTLLWLGAYCLIAARAAETLRRPRVKAALDRVTGVALIAIGLRLATEQQVTHPIDLRGPEVDVADAHTRIDRVGCRLNWGDIALAHAATLPA